jgi:hypothetical protein
MLPRYLSCLNYSTSSLPLLNHGKNKNKKQKTKKKKKLSRSMKALEIAFRKIFTCLLNKYFFNKTKTDTFYLSQLFIITD